MQSRHQYMIHTIFVLTAALIVGKILAYEPPAYEPAPLRPHVTHEPPAVPSNQRQLPPRARAAEPTPMFAPLVAPPPPPEPVVVPPAPIDYSAILYANWKLAYAIESEAGFVQQKTGQIFSLRVGESRVISLPGRDGFAAHLVETADYRRAAIRVEDQLIEFDLF